MAKANKERQKLLAATHFIVDKCSNEPEKLGAIRLNKILWFADTFAFRHLKTQITDDTYVKRAKGPVPKNILWALDELKSENKISIQEPTGYLEPRRFRSLSKPEEAILTAEEKQVLSGVIEAVLEHTANEISELSHTNIWKAAEEGEEIPIYAALADFPGPITREVYDWAVENG